MYPFAVPQAGSSRYMSSVTPMEGSGATNGFPPPNPFAPPSEQTLEQLQTMQRLLNMKLGPEMLATRQGAGNAKLTYIEAWRVIALANEVFGFNGWCSEIKSLEVDFIDQCAETGRFTIGVSAIVKIWLRDGCSREDVGYGKAENLKSKAEALDKCKKEAITDAMKRTLRTFGNLLGNCIYDKNHITEIGKMKAPKPTLDFKNLYRGECMYPQEDIAAGLAAVPSPQTSTPSVDSRKQMPPPVSKPKPVLPPIAHPAAKPTAHHVASRILSGPSAVSPKLAAVEPAEGPKSANLPRPETAFADALDDSLLANVDLDAGVYSESAPCEQKANDGNSYVGDSGFFEPPPVDQNSDGKPTMPVTPGLDRNVSRPIRRSELAAGNLLPLDLRTATRPAGDVANAAKLAKAVPPPEAGGFGSARGLKRNLSDVSTQNNDKENTHALCQARATITGDRTPLTEIFQEPPFPKRARAPPA